LDPGTPMMPIRKQSQMPSLPTSTSSTRPLQSSSLPSHIVSDTDTGVQAPPPPSGMKISPPSPPIPLLELPAPPAPPVIPDEPVLDAELVDVPFVSAVQLHAPPTTNAKPKNCRHIP